MTEYSQSGLPLEAKNWDGVSYPPKWAVTAPWPRHIFLRWYDVTQTKRETCRSRYTALNGYAVYNCRKDEFGDWLCDLSDSKYVPINRRQKHG